MSHFYEYIGNGEARVESFEFTIAGEPETLIWNVTLARWLVKNGGAIDLVPVSRETMQDVADRNQWDPAHLVHVDPTLPGIASPLIVPDDVRRLVGGKVIIYQLIDGIHRCVRALQLGLPFKAYRLTDNAARACYRGPAHYLP